MNEEALIPLYICPQFQRYRLRVFSGRSRLRGCHFSENHQTLVLERMIRLADSCDAERNGKGADELRSVYQ